MSRVGAGVAASWRGLGDASRRAGSAGVGTGSVYFMAKGGDEDLPMLPKRFRVPSAVALREGPRLDSRGDGNAWWRRHVGAGERGARPYLGARPEGRST